MASGRIEGRTGARLGMVGVLSVWSSDTIVEVSSPAIPGDDVRAALVAIGTIVVVGALVRVIAGRRTESTSTRSFWLLVAIAGVFVTRSAGEGIDRDRIERASLEMDGSIVRIEGIVRSHEALDPARRGRDRGPGSFGTIQVSTPSPVGLVGSVIRYRVIGSGPTIPVGSRSIMRGVWRAGPRIETGSMPRSPGTLLVGHPDLIDVDSTTDPLASMRSAMRASWTTAVDRVCGLDRRNVGAGGLLDALLTGRRDLLDPELGIDARRSGLAHLLAISGMHLALVGGVVLAVLGRRGPVGRAGALVVVVAFALVVTPSPSVVRSVGMAMVVGVCLLFRRRPAGRAVLMLVLAAMVWGDPTMVRSAGFQLSAVATTGLVWSSSAVRDRWFGPEDRLGIARSTFLRHRFSVIVTAAILAWISTMPITIGRFGQVAPLAVPASILGAPVLAITMITGLTASSLMVLSSIGFDWIETAALCVSRVALWSASLFAEMIRGCGSMVDPISLPTTSWGEWSSLPLGLGLAIGLGRVGPARIVSSSVVAVTVASSIVFGSAGEGRWMHVVSVGDGSSIVIRDGSTTTLYDVGSSSIGSVGSNVIVPTLRRLGVRSIDTIVISHANEDHYNGLADVIGGLPVDRVLVSDATIRACRRGRLPILERILKRADSQGVRIGTLGRGDRFRTETLIWNVLHPKRDESCRTVNDESIVLRLSDSDRPDGRGEVLLCGDIQAEAIARVVGREPSLAVRVMEVPHHGSWNPLVEHLVRLADPEIVVQSTGPGRWRNDRLSTVLRGRVRRVTCRDGAIHVDLNRVGREFRSTGGPLRVQDHRGTCDSTPP